MEIDLIAVLKNEYPFRFNEHDESIYDFFRGISNGDSHIKNLNSFENKGDYSIENCLLTEIVNHVFELEKTSFFNYKTNQSLNCCRYFSSITNSLSANVLSSNNNNQVILIDSLLCSSLSGFLFKLFALANNMSDEINFKNCFKNIIIILDSICIKKNPGHINTNNELNWYNNYGKNIVELYCDCYWVAWSFIVLHEIAHMELGHIKGSISFEQEYEADEFVYKVILDLIEKNKNSDFNSLNSVFQDYTMYSPMMLFDFYRMVRFFQNMVYPEKPYFFNPDPKSRIDRLLKVSSSIDISYDIEMSNIFYSSFLDAYDYISNQIELKYEAGKLAFLKSL